MCGMYLIFIPKLVTTTTVDTENQCPSHSQGSRRINAYMRSYSIHFQVAQRCLNPKEEMQALSKNVSVCPKKSSCHRKRQLSLQLASTQHLLRQMSHYFTRSLLLILMNLQMLRNATFADGEFPVTPSIKKMSRRHQTRW